MRLNKNILADLSMLGVTVTWGATFVLVQKAIDTMPPFTFLGVRFLIGGLLLYLFMLAFYRNTLKSLGKDIWFAGILCGFMLFLGFAFQTFGLKYTTASNAGFITGLAVVMVPFLSLWLLRHKLKPNAMIGIGVATVGLAMLSLTGAVGINFGDVLVFFCAISYAMHITLVGRYTHIHHAFPFAMIQILTCGVFNMIGAFLFEDWTVAFTPAVLFDPWVLSALLICAVLATAVAFVVQSQVQKFSTPTRTALILATEPVFAAITGYLWAGDRLSALQVVGCVLILGGMLIAELGGQHEDPSPEPNAKRPATY